MLAIHNLILDLKNRIQRLRHKHWINKTILNPSPGISFPLFPSNPSFPRPQSWFQASPDTENPLRCNILMTASYAWGIETKSHKAKSKTPLTKTRWHPEAPARSDMDFSVSVSPSPLSAALFQKERCHTCWLLWNKCSRLRGVSLRWGGSRSGRLWLTARTTSSQVNSQGWARRVFYPFLLLWAFALLDTSNSVWVL